MKAIYFGLLLAAGVATCGAALGQDTQGSNGYDALGWERGPTTLSLGTRATIAIPEGAAALNESDSSKFLELSGNLPAPNMNIVVGDNWWAAFEFDASGFIKDEESIDADALLAQLKSADKPSNEERRRLGMAELHTDAWHIPPHYDSASKRLEWALRLHAGDDPSPIINYTVRLLGRSGYERAVLVSSPESLDRDVAEFKGLLSKFDFNSGERYSEFKPGDHVAEFGLAALITGGAAAVATKTGVWKALVGFLVAGWKIILGVAIAFVAAIGKVFKRK